MHHWADINVHVCNFVFVVNNSLELWPVTLISVMEVHLPGSWQSQSHAKRQLHPCTSLIQSLRKIMVWSRGSCVEGRCLTTLYHLHVQYCYPCTYSIQGMKGHDIMQMLEHNQRLECPDKCPQPIYELMLRCWSWRCVYRLSLLCCRAWSIHVCDPPWENHAGSCVAT